jgi:hypothetical protein
MKPKFDKNHPNVLLCPKCGNNNLHQFKVETFARVEDSAKGIHVIVEGTDIMKLDNDMSGNPSARRDGVSIHFSCESCPQVSVLTVVQHKGTTYLEMN